jgi:hypothetical protein
MKTLSNHAEAARVLRMGLKRQLPGHKFQVRAEAYSMGSSIDVNCLDEVSPDELAKVKDLAGKFKMGNFNGMDDSYNYDNRHDYPQVSFVFVNNFRGYVA